MAGISAEDLDFIICSTIRGDYITPSLACVVAKTWAPTVLLLT